MRKRKRHNPRSRGTAMTEMILVLPFLMLILAMVFYFGRGMVRVQRTQSMGRYEVWRSTARAPGPHYSEPSGIPHGPLLNDTFFAGNAESITDHHWHQHHWHAWFPDDVYDKLEDEAQGVASDTGELVEEALDAFPTGRTIRLSAQHEESVPLWKQFNKSIRHRHTRIDHEWKFANNWTGSGPNARYRGGGTWMMPEVRDVFMMDLDEPLEQLQDGGNYMAGNIRGIYTRRPHYRGPDVTR